jgi:hypothetical protein
MLLSHGQNRRLVNTDYFLGLRRPLPRVLIGVDVSRYRVDGTVVAAQIPMAIVITPTLTVKDPMVICDLRGGS